MDTYRRYEKFAKIRIGVCHNNNNNSRLPMLRHLWRAVACGHRSLVFGDWLGFSGKADLKVRCHDIETRKQRSFFGQQETEMDEYRMAEFGFYPFSVFN